MLIKPSTDSLAFHRYDDSVIFQPTTDSTTMFQLLQADGTVGYNYDSVNNRHGFGTDTPNNTLQVANLINFDDTLKNISLGTYSLLSVTGIDNLAIGHSSGAFQLGSKNVWIGKESGVGYLVNAGTGNGNVGIGATSLRNLQGGANNNLGIGFESLFSLEANGQNIGIGSGAGKFVVANNNLFIGYLSGAGVSGSTNGEDNTAIGNLTLTSITTAYQNTAIGSWSGRYITTGSSNIFIGYLAGIGQTTNSNLLIIDNQNRGSIAAEETDCLIYGSFNATPASQTLRFNVGATTWHNATHSDADGGRSNQFNFKGQQSGGEETTLARIEVSHDGAADDEKGKIQLYTNSGSDTDTPTLAVTIDSAQAATIVGGFGCNGSAAQTAYTLNAASTDLPTVVALTNQIRLALIANGIAV